MPSGTVPVPAGSAFVVVAGTFPASSYQVQVTPGWNANGPFVEEASKSQTQFTVTLPNGPGVDSTLDWFVQGSGSTPPASGITSTLADYLDELRVMLHDPADQYFPLALKVGLINRAIRQRDLDTSCNRIMQPFTLTANVDVYTLADLGNPNVFDVININLLWISTRQVLEQRSKVQLDADFRPLVHAVDMPAAFAKHGPSTIYFGPKPNMGYDTEWDCAVLSPALVNLTDVDAVPYPWTKPVVYYAAYRAKLNERRYDEAQGFMQQYQENVYGSISAPTGLQRQVTPGWGR